jgi:hypothetical protein
VVQIHALHQQRPQALLQRRQCAPRKRAAAHLPAPGPLAHQARLHIVLRASANSASRSSTGGEARDGLAHQQRLFLPVALHELRGESVRRAGEGVVDVHGTILPNESAIPEITPQCVVALTWTLKDTLGEVLDVLDDPVEFLVGGGDLLAQDRGSAAGPWPGREAGSAPGARGSLWRLQRPTGVSGAAQPVPGRA